MTRLRWSDPRTAALALATMSGLGLAAVAAYAAVPVMAQQHPIVAETPLEQGVVTALNLARADPTSLLPKIPGKYTPAQTADVVNFLQHQAPDPPLIWNHRLAQAARLHAFDETNSDPVGHIGSDGSNPMMRVHAQGITASVVAEVISIGETTPDGVVTQLTTDIPGPDHPHRYDLYDDPTLKFVGVACEPNTRHHLICVIDLSSRPIDEDGVRG